MSKAIMGVDMKVEILVQVIKKMYSIQKIQREQINLLLEAMTLIGGLDNV